MGAAVRLLHPRHDHVRAQPAQRKPNPTEEEIRDGIAGNLCRCTGYAKIVEAIDCAAKKLAKAKEAEA